MEIHFKITHNEEVEKEVTLEVTEKMERKLNALKKYLGNKDELVQVYVELGKISEAHQNGNVWRTQINLDVKGQRYHADSTADHIQTAIDLAVKELEAELRKATQRSKSMIRKGGSVLKSFMRGFGSR